MPDDYNHDFPSFDDPEQETPATKPITQSILLTVKKMLGIAEEYHAFDIDIIVNINAVFLSLNQLGVGPSTPYQIQGVDETWSDFLGDQKEFMAGVQTYVYLRVRLMFDPPTNSFLVDSFQKQIQELEWRFTVQPKSQEELAHQESYKEKYKPNDSEDVEENQNGIEEASISQVSKLSIRKNKTKPKSLFDIFS